MSETSVSERPASANGRGHEIVHFPNADMVINLDAERAPTAHKLSYILKDGVPDDWERLGPTEDEIEEMEEDDDRYFGPKFGSAKGVVDGVTFFVKPKRLSGEEFHKRKESYLTGEDKLINGLGLRKAIRISQLLNSVVNEIALSPKVKEITASPEAQAIAHKYGYKSIKYVEPVIGIIDRKTGKKSLVYENIDGATNMGEMLANEDRIPRYWKLPDELENLLKANGINPNADFGHHQLLVNGDGNLYHIDAETYSKVR